MLNTERRFGEGIPDAATMTSSRKRKAIHQQLLHQPECGN
jgi:hypothetical protein